MPEPSVVATHLTKTYRVPVRKPGLRAALRSLVRREHRVVEAVRGLSLEVGAGECVGFLGPNGAGKTTTLKMLSGLLHPTSGEARVLGFVPRLRERAFLESITLVMGQKQQLLWDLPPADTFDVNRAVYGLSRADFDASYRELDELLALKAVATRPTRTLSLGERMRCELAAALLHRPRVLFLDEPTIGLDVAMQLTVRRFLREYRERTGATILLTSHDMNDVTSLCERIVVIDGGTSRFDGSPSELVRRLRPEKRVRATFAEGAEVLRPALASSGVMALASARIAEGAVELEVPTAHIEHAVGGLLALGKLVDLTVEDPPLEEVLAALFEQTGATTP